MRMNGKIFLARHWSQNEPGTARRRWPTGLSAGLCMAGAQPERGEAKRGIGDRKG